MIANDSPVEIALPVDADTQLVQISFAHAQELFKLIASSRQSLRLWLPWVDYVQDLADLTQLISYYRRKLANNGAATTCIVVRGKLAGIIGFNLINWQNQSATIGYWLAEAFRGRGLMLKACRCLVDYGFEELNLHKVHILCATKNLASQRIPETLCFSQEGLLRDGEWLNDRYVDLYSYGMLRQNWPAPSSQR